MRKWKTRLNLVPLDTKPQTGKTGVQIQASQAPNILSPTLCLIPYCLPSTQREKDSYQMWSKAKTKHQALLARQRTGQDGSAGVRSGCETAVGCCPVCKNGCMRAL